MSVDRRRWIRRKIDLKPGDRIGRLTVISEVSREKYGWNRPRRFFLFKCDCGKETVTTGYGHINSCGCLQREKAIVTGTSKRLPFGESSLRALHNSYKVRSQKRGIEFILSRDEFRKLTSSNCHYCGIPPSQIHKGTWKGGDYAYNGLDRVDNNLGYTHENSVPACFRCNTAKNTMGQAEFFEWIRRSHAHLHLS